MAYIYSITNLVNDKKYIGKTTQSNPYDRWKQHIQLANNKNNLNESNTAHSMPICRAISKYGSDKFKFRVLEECDDDKVNEREKHYIEQYNTAEGKGYNCTYGGEGISKPRKYWANHPHSKAVSCYTLEDEWIQDYDTAGVAADCLGNRKQRKCIVSCIKGITFQALGYRWAWKGEKPKMIEKRVNRRSAVYGIELKTGRKKMWKSAADAAEEIIGNRIRNLGIATSLNSPNKNKLQAHGWYLFRNKKDALSDWKPATKNRGSEYYKKISVLSNEKRKRPVKGIHIKTKEVVYFNSISEASFFIKGNKDYSACSGILKNIQNIENGKNWTYAFNHKWFYDE